LIVRIGEGNLAKLHSNTDGKIRKEMDKGEQTEELWETEILSKCAANSSSRYINFIDRANSNN
jgi:hypothetical protein